MLVKLRPFHVNYRRNLFDIWKVPKPILGSSEVVFAFSKSAAYKIASKKGLNEGLVIESIEEYDDSKS